MTRRLLIALLVASFAVGCGKDSPTAPTPQAAAVAVESLSANGEPAQGGGGFVYRLTYNIRETSSVSAVTLSAATYTFADGRSATVATTTRVGSGATVASGPVTVSDPSGQSLSGTVRVSLAFTDEKGKAGQATSVATVTPTVRLIIDGVITNGTTGRPFGNGAAGVGVVDASGQQISTTTDGNGYYVLRNIVAGPATLVAIASGFTTSTTALTLVESGSRNITLREPVPAVEYRITGTARSCSATYENSSGGTNQATVSVPFSYKWTSAKTNDFLYMSCQINNGNDTGNITVAIYKNGVLYRSGSAFGFPNIASASGSY